MRVLAIFLLVTLGFTFARKIDTNLLQNIEKQGVANILLTFSQTQDKISKISAKYNNDENSRAAKISEIRELSMIEATQSQKRVISYVKNIGPYKSLWSSNQLYLQNVNKDILLELEEFEEIVRISEERVFQYTKPEISKDSSIMAEWGVDKINSKVAVELLINATMNNIPEIRVGIMSTGK